MNNYRKIVQKDLKTDRQFRIEYRRLEREREALCALGESVRKARERRKMSQKDLAKAMHTRQPAIARIETGSISPTASTLHRLAEALDMRLIIEIR